MSSRLVGRELSCFQTKVKGFGENMTIDGTVLAVICAVFMRSFTNFEPGIVLAAANKLEGKCTHYNKTS